MKYYGKEKCRILKEIRAEIARANDIEWVVSECKHQGNCKGTCPKCEQEVRQLEAALAKREALGKKVAVVGISATLALSVTGCDPFTQPTDGVPMEGGATLPATQTEVQTGEVDGTNPVVKGEYDIPSESDTRPEETATAGVPMYPEETTDPGVVEPMGDMPV